MSTRTILTRSHATLSVCCDAFCFPVLEGVMLYRFGSTDFVSINPSLCSQLKKKRYQKCFFYRGAIVKRTDCIDVNNNFKFPVKEKNRCFDVLLTRFLP